ncbi:MAG: tetratricopeptide repeat protein [Candidatus Sungiibacteriota bacterium]
MMTYLSYGVKVPLYLLAAFLPLFFLPLPWGGDFGRELVFSALVVIAVIAWLARALAAGEFRYVHSPILYAAGAMSLALAASAVLSHAPYVAVFFADAAAERLSWLITGVLLMIAASSAFTRREEAGTALFILIFAGAASAAIAAVQMIFSISLFQMLGAGSGADANAIGTVNGLALFFAALGMMTAGLLLSPSASAWKKWVRWTLCAAGILFLLNIVLINFLSAWIAILGASVLLFGLLLIERSAPEIARPLGASSRGDTGQGTSSQQMATSAAGHGSGTRGHGITGTGIMHSTAGNFGSGTRYWVVIGLIIFFLLMIMTRGSLASFLGMDFPAEVSPSLSATLSIAGSVFKEGPVRVFFGSGPGTFGLLWEKYKDPSINQTIFWGTRFIAGQSWIATLLPTAGLIGFASVLVFLGVALITFLRAMITGRRVPLLTLRSVEAKSLEGHAVKTPDNIGISVFLGFAVLLIAAFLYPANSSLILLLFFSAGILSLALAPRHSEDAIGDTADRDPYEVPLRKESVFGIAAEASSVAIEDNPQYGGLASIERERQGEAVFFAMSPEPAPAPFWSVRARVIRFATPWSIFASSLVIIFFIAIGAAALYENINRASAARAVFDGIAAANKGDIDRAIADIGRAVAREPRDFHILQVLVQARAAKIQQLIARAAGGQNVQQEFQSAVSLAIQDSQRLVQIYPDEPEVWRIQGGLYESIIPYIQGSERFAVTAYQKAIERGPVNPAVFVEWGRAGLVFTERILALENQAKGKDRDDLAAARKQNLEQIAAIFQRAIQVKQDYAPAHFLLAQTAIRLGNMDAAIQSVENAKAAAPFDIGVAFQLGLLYYQKQDFDLAQAEFERAISMNENYSNARYFLALIYDKKGDKARALEQFTKIGAVNPDNQEVKRIIENLTAGKTALDGIVPPLPPPEKRNDAPVKEAVQKK